MPLPIPFSRGLAAAALALVLLPTAALAVVRPEPKPERVDLSVRPGDLKLAAPAFPQPSPAVEPRARDEELTAGYTLSEQVEATDRVRRGEIPDRRRLQNDLAIGGEGGPLEQLLEDQTIMLFRVTVESPL
jgi:hypothetical protein